MAEDLHIAKGTKAEIYQSIIPQIKSLLDGETDVIANLANVAAALKEQFGWLWVGFYLVKPATLSKSSQTFQKVEVENSGDTELVLGPFQGPVACTRIRKGRGVCGTAWAKARSLIVPDVEAFPGHIACSSLSKSEIVIPLLHQGEVVAVLDVDSTDLSTFDETDQLYLEEIAGFINW